MEPPLFAVKQKGAAVRGLTDRESEEPARPKTSHAQLPRHDTSGERKTPELGLGTLARLDSRTVKSGR